MSANLGRRAESTLEVTNNAVMQEVLQTIRRVASSNLSVLITGEAGTGKEWAARTIHRLGTRSIGPFWPFDCASIPAEEIDSELFGSDELSHDGLVIKHGAFEHAAKGTLFLNQIAFLPPTAQMKIARTLEYGMFHRLDGLQSIEIDVGIISALTDNYETSIKNGSLLGDLFYRLSAILIELPPLRERREDIPLLIDKFLEELKHQNARSSSGMTNEALQLCQEYDWPGNIRQLRNAIEHASVMSTYELIGPDHLPSYLLAGTSGRKHSNNVSIKKRSSSH